MVKALKTIFKSLNNNEIEKLAKEIMSFEKKIINDENKLKEIKGLDNPESYDKIRKTLNNNIDDLSELIINNIKMYIVNNVKNLQINDYVVILDFNTSNFLVVNTINNKTLYLTDKTVTAFFYNLIDNFINTILKKLNITEYTKNVIAQNVISKINIKKVINPVIKGATLIYNPLEKYGNTNDEDVIKNFNICKVPAIEAAKKQYSVDETLNIIKNEYPRFYTLLTNLYDKEEYIKFFINRYAYIINTLKK